MRFGLVAVLLLGCPGESTPLAPGSPERGAPIYATYCVSCHQADGSGVVGGSRMAGAFSGAGSRLSQPDDVLLRSIADGKVGPVGTMPPWKGVLSEQQRADVLAYVRATFSAPP